MNKILFITPSRSIGGTNASLSSIVNHLSRYCIVDVLTMSSYGNGSYACIQSAYTNILLDAYLTNFEHLSGITKYLSILIKFLKRFSLFFQIPFEKLLYKFVAQKLQKNYQYDYIVGFSEGRAMKFASQFNNAIKYTWVHCEYDRAVPLNIDESSYYSRFNKILCVSKYTRELFVHRYPSLLKNTEYIYNLLDLNRILNLSNEDADDVRFDNSLYTILSVGRIDPVKGFSKIPQVANELVQKQVHFKWYIIGGPINEEYKLIQREIDKYGVSEQVILLGSKTNPYPYYKKSNLYVSTSISEACPMVFNEAKLLGLPIISTNYGSAFEFVQDKSNITSIDSLSEIIYLNYLNSVGRVKANNCCYSESISCADAKERQKIDELFSM